MRRVELEADFLRPTVWTRLKYPNAVYLRKEGSAPSGQPAGREAMALAGLVMGALIFCREPAAWAQGGQASPAATAASAKGDLITAKKHYDDGETKFRAGDFGGAEIDFRIANNIKATPQAERYIGRCLEELGRYQGAVEWYEKFLAHVPDKMASLADRTRKRTLAIRAMPGKLHIESRPAGAAIAIDGRPESSPAPVDVDLGPGAHTITFTAPGRVKFEKSIDVAFASTQTVNGELEAEAATAPVVAAADPGGGRPPTEDAAPQAPPQPSSRSRRLRRPRRAARRPT